MKEHSNNFQKIKLFLSVFLTTFLFFSCSGDNGGGNSGGGESIVKPTNLVIAATPVGVTTSTPNGDGSGTVNFTFSATNATSYKIALGDGVTQESTSGSFSYTYNAAGTNSYTVYVSAYNGAQFVSTSISVAIYVAPKAIWADEFNIDGAPDSSKWGYDTGTGDWGWGNNEAQYYTSRADNVKVQNGVLKITTIKENYNGSNYTSARIKTQGKFSFKYGKVEMRAKMPVGGGTWPALWMLGDNITSAGWPACGEIDIMEHWGSNQNYVQSAMHTPSSFGGTVNLGGRTVSTASSAFHIYTLEWTAEKMVFSVDSIVHYTYNPSDKNASTWPFDSEQYLLMNVAIQNNISSNITQAAMEVDYVRVYQETKSNILSATKTTNVKVYPNPFTHKLVIAIEANDMEDVAVEIQSLQGQVLYSALVNLVDGKMEINGLDHLPAGVYFLRYSIGGIPVVVKVVK